MGSRVQKSGVSKGSLGNRREQEEARRTWRLRLFALCPAEAWWVFAASHQPCTEEEVLATVEALCISHLFS